MYLHIRTCTLVVCFRFLLGNGILCKIVLTIKGDKAPHHHCPLSLSLVTMTHQHDSSRIGTDKAPHHRPLKVAACCRLLYASSAAAYL